MHVHVHAHVHVDVTCTCGHHMYTQLCPSHIPWRTGIGRATVKALARFGAEVIALSRTQSDLDSLNSEVHVVHV